MNTMGIDIGHQRAKAVIFRDNRIAGHVSLAVAGEVQAAAKIVFGKVLKQAREKKNRIDRVFATGVGRKKVAFADGHPTEMLSHVHGAHWLFPAARTVIDFGAEGSRISSCDSNGNLTNFVMNDKCASGAGVFLETVAEMMRISLSDMGPLSLKSSHNLTLTNTCAVFAESEIVAEIHRGTSKENILRGVHESIASKVASAGNRTDVKPEVVLTGGVAQNIGVVEALKEQLGFDIWVPSYPEIVGALGAAILAGN